MTVCATALFSMPDGSAGVLGASDRMLTVPPDIQYEPHQQPKIHRLTNSIVIMTAGDSALQADVLHRVSKKAYELIDIEKRWLVVREIAVIYSEAYAVERQARAEMDVLRPLGLNFSDWVSRQQELAPNIVAEIAKELWRFQAASISAIIVGVDPSGPHIYVVRNSDVTCHDKVGFATIGVGKNHAGSEFMFAGHSRFRPYPETLLLVHRAKKRAEAAPGVGKETDMFVIGPKIGTYTPLLANMVLYLDEIFNAAEEEKRKVIENSEKEINGFFEELRAQYQQNQEQEKGTTSSIGDGKTDDAKEVPNEPETSEPED